MKKAVIAITIIVVLVAVIVIFKQKESDDTSNSRAKQEKDIAKQDEKQRAEITFIELGSVNCVPCKAMQPVMKNIETKHPNKVEVVFYDVWTPEHRAKSAEYKIKVIPTQVFLDKNGKEFFRHEGFFPEEEIVSLIEKQIQG